MTDAIDQGCRFEAKFTQMAVANQLAATAKAQASNTNSSAECAECGNEIPEKRRENVPGCKYCTRCQQLAEEGKL